MIRNILVTGMVSVVMGVFAVAYTAVTPPQDRPSMPGGARTTGKTPNSSLSDPMLAQQGLMLFRGQIRPLLVGTCLPCHDSKKRSGGLDLTRRATALSGGETGEAVVPGKPDESLMMQLITAGEMPKGGGPLSSQTIAALTRWIELGAPYEGEPLTYRTGPPTVAMQSGMTAVDGAGGMKMCPCMQMMMGGMSGQGMMGGQAGQAAAGSTPISNPRTKDQARQRAVDYLKSAGNPHLKVGDVNETIASFEIQVVTKDGALANWIIIDKKSGKLKLYYSN